MEEVPVAKRRNSSVMIRIGIVFADQLG